MYPKFLNTSDEVQITLFESTKYHDFVFYCGILGLIFNLLSIWVITAKKMYLIYNMQFLFICHDSMVYIITLIFFKPPRCAQDYLDFDNK